MSSDQFEVTVIPEIRFYPKTGMPYNDYGIFNVKVTDSDRWDLIETTFDNITIKGNMPDLEIGRTYIATVSKKVDPKYGVGYQVGLIYMKQFTTIEEQKVFLSAILTEHQINSLINAYPNENLIDLIKEGNIDISLVKGVGEKTLEKIKDKIISNEKYQSAIIKLSGEFGIPYNSVKKLTDKYGSPDVLIDKINENPYLLTEVDGFGFIKVDEIALRMGVDKKSKHRVNACVEFILEEEAGSGHSWIKKTSLINRVTNLINLSIDYIDEVISDENISKKYEVKNGIVYKTKYYHYELYIKENIERIVNSNFKYKINDLDDIIRSVEKKQGYKYTDEQRRAIEHAVKYNICIVNGKAGTGKTTVIKGIIEVLKTIKKPKTEVFTRTTEEGFLEDNRITLHNDDGTPIMTELDYATCALSGKASQRIQESTGLDSHTIHRLYGYNPKLGGWKYNEDNPLPKDVIVLDEASMVNAELFYYILRAIEDGAKLIITGDTAQLEPIGVGNVLVDMIECGKIPKVELTIVHRQAQRSGILSSANMVREGKKFINNNDFSFKKLGELQDLYVYPCENGERVYKRVMALAKRYNGDILDFQIITPMKTRGKISSKNINEECQKLFNQDPKDVDSKYKIERKNVSILEGDKVIMNGNDYNLMVYNGTIGIVKYIDTTCKNKNGETVGEIVIDFEGVGDVRLTKYDMNQIDLAYALTVHKCQGSEWKYVVFAMDYSSYVLLNRQLTYTGMTRAREALFMAVELKALQHSIDTNKSIKRRTFLPMLMKKENKNVCTGAK